MDGIDIGRLRMANQRITARAGATPQEVVAALGAMQAQDYPSALWAVGLRLPGESRAGVERSIADGAIVRTWAMRGTLHLVAAADVRWILGLLAPRVIARSAPRRMQLEIDAATLSRSADALEGALSGGSTVRRGEAMDLLKRAGVETAGQRGIHILRHLSLIGLLCQSAFLGGQATFALLDERVPASRAVARDDALAALAFRYFDGHGPATLRDFVWWSGLTVADAKAGVGLSRERLTQETIGDVEYWMTAGPLAAAAVAAPLNLLPGFDEYILGYADRTIALDEVAARRIVPGANGIFLPAVVWEGRVVGLWRLGTAKRPPSVVELFRPLDDAATHALAAALRADDVFSTGTVARA